MAVREVTLAGLSRDQLLKMYYQMALLRCFEEKAAEEYTLGKIGGFLHLYIGQEANGVGMFSALGPDDYVLSAYREHGYAILKGVDPHAVMAELFGKATGCSRGKGGSMHMYSEKYHLLGGQAIVGAQLVMGAGVGLAIQYRGEHRIALVLFGDGAVDEGAFHEALNLASLWKLPVVLVCENNQYSMGMAVTKAWSVDSLEPRAAAYGIPYHKVDGMDALAVREATLAAREHAMSGAGPVLIEALTYRFRGHSMADPAHYRTREEEQLWKTTRDPILLFEEKLTAAGIMRDEDIRAINEKVELLVEECVQFAENSPDPDPDSLYTDVTQDGSGAIAWHRYASTPKENDE
ncbi:MAG: pyruvate dehydrogenase (acetyl-transferring) E1 component subunit alpha [Ktedonobacterales bacterium]